MKDYIFKDIERKWQKKWLKSNTSQINSFDYPQVPQGCGSNLCCLIDIFWIMFSQIRERKWTARKVEATGSNRKTQGPFGVRRNSDWKWLRRATEGAISLLRHVR